MKLIGSFCFFKQFGALSLVLGLLSFRPNLTPPPGISGVFNGPYNQNSSVCNYPLQFSVCNQSGNANQFLTIHFLGNSYSPEGVQVTGVQGGQNVRYYSNNEVRLSLPIGECATILVDAIYATESNVGAYLNGEEADRVNIVSTAQGCQ